MINPAKTAHADLADLTNTTVVARLNSLALIEVTGEDAQSFLQGQLSNDVDAIAAIEHGSRRAWPCQLNAYCNPKGRVLALIRLVRHATGFWMLVPAGLADGLIKRLKMYVLRARVDIAMKPQTVLLGLMGGEAGEADDDDSIERVSIDGVVHRQILVGEKQAMDDFVQTSGYEARNDDDLWRLTDILSGIPQVYPQTIEAFIPQMINLELVDGLSFTKGCFPGQEIVARLRYRGKVKQRMLAATVSESADIAPGDPIYLHQRADQKAGVVVDAVQTGTGEYTLSAIAPATMPEAETLRVGSATGAELHRIPLPYPAPTEQSRSP